MASCRRLSSGGFRRVADFVHGKMDGMHVLLGNPWKTYEHQSVGKRWNELQPSIFLSSVPCVHLELGESAASIRVRLLIKCGFIHGMQMNRF